MNGGNLNKESAILHGIEGDCTYNRTKYRVLVRGVTSTKMTIHFSDVGGAVSITVWSGWVGLILVFKNVGEPIVVEILGDRNTSSRRLTEKSRKSTTRSKGD